MNFESLKKIYLVKYPKSSLSDDKLADYFRYIKIERPGFDIGDFVVRYYFVEPSNVESYLRREAAKENDQSRHPHTYFQFSNFAKNKKCYQKYNPNSQLNNSMLVALFRALHQLNRNLNMEAYLNFFRPID